ncbi:MAG: hypothetical protein M1833_003802 [Piccolia ochrophora]|nr:MAG: hypothetical protein M1833_003802 [Piccolia ochrophora]
MTDDSLTAPPPAPSLPPEKPHPLPLRSLYPYLSHTDNALLRLNRILSTPAGFDAILATLSYTLQTYLALPHPSSASQTNPRLRSLASLLSSLRPALRLPALLSIYAWARATYLSPPASGVLRAIAWAQVVANAAYLALENGAYLAERGVLGWGKARRGRAEVWSARAWAVHVGLELGRLWVVRNGRDRGAGGEKARGGEEEAEDERKWWREVGVNAAYAPLTLHWSVERGVVGEVWVGVLGSVAAVMGLVDVWREAAR